MHFFLLLDGDAVFVNQMTGSIPTELGQLSKMESLLLVRYCTQFAVLSYLDSSNNPFFFSTG